MWVIGRAMAKAERAIIAMSTGMILLSLTACSVARRIPDGSYLLKRNIIEADKDAPRRERISAGTLGRYVAQSPGKHFLGTDLYAWIYSQADPEKDNGWNRFLRRTGEEPVIWSSDKTERSAESLKNHIASRGFFGGTAGYSVDTLRGGKKVRVRYSVRQGAPSRIGTVRYTFRDTLLREFVLADSTATLLREGDIFDAGVLDAERERIVAKLKDRGYYDINVGHITYIADSTQRDRVIDLEVIVRRWLAEYRDNGQPIYENHRVYRLGEIYVHSDYDPMKEGEGSVYGSGSGSGVRFDTLQERGMNIIYDGRQNMRSRVLRRAIRIRRDSLYSASGVAATSGELMQLGAFRSVSVLFEPVEKRLAGGDVSEGLLNCYIRCVPGLRQSFGMDIEGSTTSSFYGLRATLGYQNRNTFRGAELLAASLTGGFEFLKSSARKLSYELGASVSLAFPRFVFWEVDRYGRARNPLSTLTLSANWQDRSYYSRALFGLSWGYGWGVRRFENFTIRPFDINLVRMGHIDPDFQRQLNNPYLAASYGDQLIAGISASYVYNNQPRNLMAGAEVLRLNVETTGNLLSGLVRLFGARAVAGAASGDDSGTTGSTAREYYNIFGIQFSQYARGDVSFSQKIVLGEKTALAYRIQGGALYSYGNSNSTSPPFDKFFFAGGVNSMRGWAVRTLGPGTQLYEQKNYPAQRGDVKLEANLEFRFPIFSPVNGALFFDAGNIWFMRSKPDEYPDEAVFHLRSFARQLGFNTGVGVRVDLRFVVLRLDWGIQLHSPGRPAGERWIHDFRWGNTALSFGVGYPF